MFAAHPSPGIDLRAGPRFTSSDLVLRAAVLGLGVALARDRAVREDIASGLLFRPFEDLRIEVPDAYWLVQPAEHQPRAAVAAVVDWIKLQVDRQHSPKG